MAGGNGRLGGYSGSVPSSFAGTAFAPVGVPQTLLDIPLQPDGPSLFLLNAFNNFMGVGPGAPPTPPVQPSGIRYRVTQDIGQSSIVRDCGPFLPQVIFCSTARVEATPHDGTFSAEMMSATATRVESVPSGQLLDVFPFRWTPTGPTGGVRFLPSAWTSSLPLIYCRQLYLLPFENGAAGNAGLWNWSVRYNGGAFGPFMPAVWSTVALPMGGSPLSQWQANAWAAPTPVESTSSFSVPFHRAFDYGINFQNPAPPATMDLLVLALT